MNREQSNIFLDTKNAAKANELEIVGRRIQL